MKKTIRPEAHNPIVSVIPEPHKLKLINKYRVPNSKCRISFDGSINLGVGYDEINKLESSLRWEMWQDHKSKSAPFELRLDLPGSGKRYYLHDLLQGCRRFRIEEIKKEIRKKKKERLKNIISTAVDEFFYKGVAV